MIVAAIDPGTEMSAIVVWDGQAVRSHGIYGNQEMLEQVALGRGRFRTMGQPDEPVVLVLEKVESYGMSVGESVFATVFWSGRFAQAWSPGRFEQLGRRHVKQHLCHTARATDSNIRQAILDRFGGEKAIGKKASKGPLYGLKGHEFAALAVALTWHDQHADRPEPIRPGVTGMF